MKIRNLVLLVILAVALAGWAAWTMRPQPQPGTALIGTRVLPKLPVNQVSKIVLTTATNTLTLAKVKGIWTVANRFNYPAAFDKIAENLLQLSEIKVGQVIAADESQNAALNLLDPAAGDKKQSGTRVELKDENDGMIAMLLIGKPFMRQSPEGGQQGPLSMGDYPDGQYVKTSAGRIFLVGQTFDRLTDGIENWLATEFVNVAANDIQNITVTAPDRAPIKLVRSKTSEAFTLEGLKEGEGTLDSAKVNQMAGALNMLGFDDIAAPTLSSKETGMEHPVIFEASTRQGRIYTLRIGNTLTNDTFDRYLKVTVDWKAPAEAKDKDAAMAVTTNAVDAAKAERQKADEAAKNAAEAKALNDRLATWTFIIKSYRAEPLLIKRQDLIKKTEPAGEQKANDSIPTVTPEAKSGRQAKNVGDEKAPLNSQNQALNFKPQNKIEE